MSSSGISISAIPRCVSDLKEAITDLKRLADGESRSKLDDLFTEDDFEILALTHPEAVREFGSFRSLQRYVSSFITEHMDDPLCQQEFGRNTEPWAVYLSQIPLCMPDIREEFLELDKDAGGNPHDGMITRAEFRRLQRIKPDLRGFKSFRQFSDYIKDAVDSRRCDPECLDGQAIPYERPVICIAPPAPDLPAQPKPQPRKSRDDKPQIAKADPPPAVETPPEPQEVAQQGPPSPPMDPEKLNIELSWNVFERMYGSEQLDQERREYWENLRKEKSEPWKFGKLSAKTMAAAQNNKSWVRGANLEPLGHLRQRLFMNYLDVIHNKLHPLFADSFLRSLDSLSRKDPLNDMSLHAELEFEIMGDGSAVDIRVIKTSGIMVFDAAAVDSLFRVFPVQPPPREILSWNNRVYFQWGFYRNARKCGTFNAKPYLVRAPGGKKESIPEEMLNVDSPVASEPDAPCSCSHDHHAHLN